MSDLSKHNKTELIAALSKLEIKFTRKDTKKVLLSKLQEYIEENENGLETVKQTLEESSGASGEGDEEEITIVDSEDEDDITDAKIAAEDLGEEEDEDEDDKDYQAPPPFNVKDWVVDPLISIYEQGVDKFYEIGDCVGLTFTNYSSKLRQQLSSTVTLNYLELVIELAVFLYQFVSIVPLNENKLIPQSIIPNLPFLGTSTVSTFEITELFTSKAISIFFFWVVTSILGPLVISYYLNFTRRIVEFEEETLLFRVYDFDPFIFAISKVFLFYLVGHEYNLLQLVEGGNILCAIKNQFLIYSQLYAKFTLSFGNWPYVIGGVNVLIALYSQFEEY
ncbi:uncharacterized protein J8A68_000794 [[Candida] subhashii]|uniref:SAP domain-containing protein n=1 Tax=[Candida] subhashii TaxID=561895 RepID=A0A8J5QSF5_9ASCO|nr:uncharacterized protein J8A68_000794 [[Candida] subhashii]KAG7665588.1 hypothetical protein J8A68_000794 [[Candida] subhashii]